MKKIALSNASFFLLTGLLIFINFTGLFNDIMEPDGALYATIAKQISTSNNWINLWVTGTDWLDKPHLPFWLAAISFKCFGVTAFAYKFPSFIFFIVSIIYCYKLSAAIYGKLIAQLASIIYAAALHIIISNFDGKVEIYLTAFIIGATYHMYKAHQNKWLWHVVAAALLSACAVMTKGIFSLITIAAGFVIYWIKTKQWNEFLKPKWYLLVLFIFIFIIPELYALYVQFDLHPEKKVFGKTQVSGLKFFFWDSQFGRFFNNGPIKGNGDLFFFFHTTLWAFLPWPVFLLFAIPNTFFNKVKLPGQQYRCIIGGSAFTTFLIFSISKFQLPHYIIIIFPHLAIMCASYISEQATEKILKRFTVIQTLLLLLLVMVLTWVAIDYSISRRYLFFLLSAAILCSVFLLRRENNLWWPVKISCCFTGLIAIFLNMFFYPSLLQYQAGMMAGKWLNSNKILQPVIAYKCELYSFDFYYKGNIIYDSSIPITSGKLPLATNSVLLFSSVKNIKNINADSFTVRVLKAFPNFRVSQLNATFLNSKTRYLQLDSFAIASLKIKK